MIAKYLLWVYLCAGPNCHCERITFGVSEKQLYLKTSCVELSLTQVGQKQGEYFLMAQDTSLYAVKGVKNQEGMYVFINHVSNSGRVDKTITIEFNGRCLPQDL